jgi:uncharacterized membrane protein YhhN
VPVAVAAALLAALVGVHLAADARGRAIPRAAGKLGASAVFVAVALSRGPQGAFDRRVVAGLLLSVAGDALLLSSRRPAFVGGLVAFLLAHVAYVLAFAAVARPSAGAAAAVVLATAAVLAWLWPRLGDLRAAVAVYCAVISAMLWLALGVGRLEVRLVRCSSTSPICWSRATGSCGPDSRTARSGCRSTTPASCCSRSPSAGAPRAGRDTRRGGL